MGDGWGMPLCLQGESGGAFPLRDSLGHLFHQDDHRLSLDEISRKYQVDLSKVSQPIQLPLGSPAIFLLQGLLGKPPPSPPRPLLCAPEHTGGSEGLGLSQGPIKSQEGNQKQRLG